MTKNPSHFRPFFKTTTPNFFWHFLTTQKMSLERITFRAFFYMAEKISKKLIKPKNIKKIDKVKKYQKNWCGHKAPCEHQPPAPDKPEPERWCVYSHRKDALLSSIPAIRARSRHSDQQGQNPRKTTNKERNRTGPTNATWNSLKIVFGRPILTG